MTDGSSKIYKKDFWTRENPRYAEPHFRLRKSARIINRIAAGRRVDLLDVGCGPASLSSLLDPSISYYGIDIALSQPAPNLREIDILETPVTFDRRGFDIVVTQGVFEYLGERWAQKFGEIAAVLRPGGTFVVSYVNFDHRHPSIYWPYSNVQPFGEFVSRLGDAFDVVRVIPTSHNWNHSEPNRKWLVAVNMRLDRRIPYVTSKLGVEYFVVCTAKSVPPVHLEHERKMSLTS